MYYFKKPALLIMLLTGAFMGDATAQSWTVFNTSNSGLPGNSVYDIAIDSSNTLWVATGDGLAKFDGANWTVFNSANTPIPPSVNDDLFAVYVDWFQNVWVGTDGGYLFRYDQDTTWTDFSAGGFGDILSINQDYDGKIWVGHFYGLKSLDDTLWTDHTTQLPDDYVTTVEVDTDNHIWAGTKQGVAVFDNDSTWVSYTPSNSPISPSNPWIESIRRGFGDDIWIGSRDGIYLFDKDTTWVKFSSANTPLWDDKVTGVDIDTDSIIWIANDAASMGKFKTGTWSNIFFPSNINFSRDVLVDLNGNKWIGAQDGLARYNPTGGGPIYLQLTDVDGGSPITAFPNPVSDRLTLEYMITEPGNCLLTLMDQLGQEVWSCEPGYLLPDNYSMDIDLSHLPDGTYHLVFSQNEHFAVQTILISR